MVTTQGVPLPTTKIQNENKTKNKDPEKKGKKQEKKSELFLRILPQRTRLLMSLHMEKAPKVWPTATILNEILHLVKFMYARNIR